MKKIAELKEIAKSEDLSPRTRRMFRNKASAQQSRLDKKLAYWKLKQQFRRMKHNFEELARTPKPTMAKVREILKQSGKV